MDKPTQEQIEEFWERCGLHKDGHFWYTVEGKQLSEEMPDIDLNNLFGFAVPKLKPWRESVNLMQAWLGKVMYAHQDPALALFWALWQARETAIKHYEEV